MCIVSQTVACDVTVEGNQRGIADTRGLRRKLPTKVRIKTSRITAIMFVKVRALMVTGKKIGSVRVEI